MMRTLRLVHYTTILALSFSALAALGQDQAPIEQQMPKWQTTASAGVTLTRGNSETFLATLSANTLRKWDTDQLSLGADAAIGKTKDQSTGVTSRNSDSYRGYGQFDHLFSERCYAFVRAEGLYDSIAAISYRVILSPGAGYYLMKKKSTDLSVEAGPSYIFQKLGGETSSFASLRAAEKFHLSISDRARLWETVEWLPRVEDFNNYIINAELGIAADLTAAKNLSLSLVLQDSYNSVPAAGRKANDLKLIAAINYKF